MEELFQKYTAAFDALDASAIASLYTLPCAASDGDGINVFSDRESLIEKFSVNCKSMKTMGYKSSVFNILDVTDMGATIQAVNIGWRVHIKDSAIEFRCMYICHLIGSSWYIFNANVYQGSFSNAT